MAGDRQILELDVPGLRHDNEGMRRRLFQYRHCCADCGTPCRAHAGCCPRQPRLL